MKLCTKCGTEQPLANFYNDKHKKDGKTIRCKACIKPANQKYSQANKQSRNEYNRIWYQVNKEKRLKQCSEWAKANRGKKNAHWMKRRMLKLEQTPNMYDDEIRMIERLYAKAAELTKTTGVVHHVDHIVPISQGGPHCYLNLQILTAAENLSKGSTWGGVLSK